MSEDRSQVTLSGQRAYNTSLIPETSTAPAREDILPEDLLKVAVRHPGDEVPRKPPARQNRCSAGTPGALISSS